ncbi:DUF167 family protein [Atopomonas sediminilitoris]|uniref:DUF167 family protein n=1 Tax=Atopomonas sediminilitoris TaxID=2919919 RepID=UPI001F4D37AC|nr:DUF167 family protein [Atopomonas sediminilitoris]MCJ8170552.1 DUF167 family protein [Atopomonas sediminilitoris]
MPTLNWDGDDLILDCHLQPRASRDEFCGWHDGRIKIRLTAPPVDGQANTLLVKFLAKQFAVSKSCVSLISGQQSRQKRVRIHAPKALPEVLKTTDQSL